MDQEQEEVKYNEKKFIAEDILKKKTRDQAIGETKAKHYLKAKKEKKEKKEDQILPPDQFIKAYQTKQKSYAYLKKRTKKVERSSFEEPEQKLILIIRIRGVKNLSPTLNKIFKRLKLQEINSAVFMNYNKKVTQILKSIEPFVTYGYPSKKIISELIYKKGFARIDNKREVLTNNELIENNLGEMGMICTEDIINEINTVGPSFNHVNKFLWPFKLTSCESLKIKKKKPYRDGGQWGNRENKINDLILEMI